MFQWLLTDRHLIHGYIVAYYTEQRVTYIINKDCFFFFNERKNIKTLTCVEFALLHNFTNTNVINANANVTLQSVFLSSFFFGSLPNQI